MIELAASILSADFAHLADNVLAAFKGGATIVHLDVMDGHFVPNLTIGPPIVRWLRPVTDAVFDVHLMIENQINSFRTLPPPARTGSRCIRKPVCT